jgi:two-component system OmpR family response regulator/two-component system response regulator QseB
MKKRILILDDDLCLGQQMSEALHDLGYAVSRATNQAEAVALAGQTAFDLCLLDYKLENTSGSRVLKDLKKGQPTSRFAIVSGKPNIEKCLEKEGVLEYVDAVIPKPFRPTDFFAKIESLLANEVTAD